MPEDLRFDVAISSAQEDAWIARDLSNLIERAGFSVYCYLQQPDLVQGFVRTKLRDIYSDSSLNVVVWSNTYCQKPESSIPAMERRCLSLRHVEKGEADSLLILSADQTPLERDLEPILAHDLRQGGLTAIEKFIIQRLKKLWSLKTGSTLAMHPPGTEQDRGPLKPCSFTIHPSFEADPLGRWKRLADVRVNSDIPRERSDVVYLIPSGLATPFLRHSSLLKLDPHLLKRKRRATENFVRQCSDRPLEGFWFAMKKDLMKFPTVYCAAYDAFLNKSYEHLR